jgi:hypothetical protein
MCPYYVAGIVAIAALMRVVYTTRNPRSVCASECGLSDIDCTICSVRRASAVGSALPCAIPLGEAPAVYAIALARALPSFHWWRVPAVGVTTDT